MIDVYRLCSADGTDVDTPTLDPAEAMERARFLRSRVERVRCEPKEVSELWDFTGEEEEQETTWPDYRVTSIPPAI